MDRSNHLERKCEFNLDRYALFNVVLNVVLNVLLNTGRRVGMMENGNRPVAARRVGRMGGNLLMNRRTSTRNRCLKRGLTTLSPTATLVGWKGFAGMDLPATAAFDGGNSFSVIRAASDPATPIGTAIVTEPNGHTHFIPLPANSLSALVPVVRTQYNAIKYTPAPGRITPAAGPEDRAVVFRVADTDAGIPREQLPLVFDRFCRAESRGRGASADRGGGLRWCRASSTRTAQRSGSRANPDRERPLRFACPSTLAPEPRARRRPHRHK